MCFIQIKFVLLPFTQRPSIFSVFTNVLIFISRGLSTNSIDELGPFFYCALSNQKSNTRGERSCLPAAQHKTKDMLRIECGIKGSMMTG
jgi:hypothetical protein